MTRLVVSVPSLVLLVGPAGCGKSVFARRHFAETEVVSSDRCRALVSDDEADQRASAGAFAVLHAIVEERLRNARLTVVDATNLQPRAREPLLALARRHHLPVQAVLFDLPVELCEQRAAARQERPLEAAVVREHARQLQDARLALVREPYHDVHRFHRAAEVDAVEVLRAPLPVDRRHDAGPFDLIGDVHGCLHELQRLLSALGYAADEAGVWRHPQRRRAIFLGDLVDRGPDVAGVLRLAMDMVDGGSALAVPGNHDDKLRRRLEGRNVTVAHGLQESIDSLVAQPAALSDRVRRFLAALPSHLVLDGGRLVAVHAGMRERYQGRDSRRVRDFALYGDTTGEVDELGVPVRRDWAREYHGAAAVVYGHTPVARPLWVNETLNVDTGCVFGGALTALRWPEREIVCVRAARAYAVPSRTIGGSTAPAAGG